MKRRAQTEIMGLAIVIILIVIGMTFVIRFIIAEEPVDYKKDFTHSELATNMLNTFLETTSKGCKQLSMTELLQNCGATSSGSTPSEQINCKCIESPADYCECPSPPPPPPPGLLPPPPDPPPATCDYGPDEGIMSSCEYVNETAKDIFEKTLKEWGTDYVFKVFLDDEDSPIIFLPEPRKECPGNKKSKLFPLPTDTGVLSVKLDICG
tara:strand:- start:7 stop:633 length:627 start_codon:yes stop_codon:yes gene_type:complete